MEGWAEGMIGGGVEGQTQAVGSCYWGGAEVAAGPRAQWARAPLPRPALTSAVGSGSPPAGM